MPKLSVTVITKNEADSLPAALESVTWADEILVVDSGSTDDTRAIAGRYTDRVVEHEWTGYGAQKNHAATLASHDWILSLDADERVTADLATEIQSELRAEPRALGYRIPRVSHYLGRWIRSTDWYPDYQLRLYDRRAARWVERPVHESVRVDGTVRRLSSNLQHHPYRDISEHLATIDRYTSLAAAQMAAQGQRAGLARLVAHPPLAFLRNYVLRLGVRDGSVGLIVSVLNAYYVFLKLAKLRELQQGDASGATRA